MEQKQQATSRRELQKSWRILVTLFVAMSVLVATHLGEFWPFSIYPMFSRAGKPWSRAIVRDLSTVPDSLIWAKTSIDEIPGAAFALRDHGIEGPDVANFVVKNRDWSLEAQEAFRKIFFDYLDDRPLMLYRLDGQAVGDEVTVQAIPVLYMSSDTTMVSPTLAME